MPHRRGQRRGTAAPVLRIALAPTGAGKHKADAMTSTDLWLIRHGPALDEGRLAGRRDVAARTEGAAALAAVLGRPARIVTSPALRCRQTAAALWPDMEAVTDARLWEQDFGAWEGMPYADLPDLGPLDPAALAAAAPHGGESFADLCARTMPALEALAGVTAVVAHAGTIRAALARACGSIPAALAFQIAPLSLTRIIVAPGGWSIVCVNRTLA